MIHKMIASIVGAFICLLLAGCVTAIDEALPYAQLPEITVATEFNLVASPSHPTAYLAADPIPAGEALHVIGTDKDAAWLLVLHENQIGWMPTFYSRTNVGTLQAWLMGNTDIAYTILGSITVNEGVITIANNTIEDSFAYGIWYDANSAPQLSGNKYKGNAEGDEVQAQ